jgi:hypothetical protein
MPPKGWLAGGSALFFKGGIEKSMAEKLFSGSAERLTFRSMC